MRPRVLLLRPDYLHGRSSGGAPARVIVDDDCEGSLSVLMRVPVEQIQRVDFISLPKPRCAIETSTPVGSSSSGRNSIARLIELLDALQRFVEHPQFVGPLRCRQLNRGAATFDVGPLPTITHNVQGSGRRTPPRRSALCSRT